ncbi:MAG: hypothetical protein K5695_15435 [Oscillospiraceae bacterium]|nr:hypothetical protein [Oscillospiraceae bacterium]
MEEFKKKLKTQQLISSMICTSSLAIYFLLRFLTKDVSDFAQGLTTGFWVAIEVLALVNTVRLLVTLRNEEEIKKLYIQEKDERNIAIQKETSQKSSVINVIVLGLAVLVAGFFDIKVSVTLFAVLSVSALITIAVNLYYRNKM